MGDAYPLEALTQTQRELAQDFVELGLLFKRKAKSKRFYPTSIAVNLIFGSSLADGGGRAQQQQGAGAGVVPVRRDKRRQGQRFLRGFCYQWQASRVALSRSGQWCTINSATLPLTPRWCE